MRSNELIKNVPSSEQMKEWDEKETVQGSQQKADEALRLAKEYAVPKTEGKQLSDENYTIAEKEKLAGLFNYVHPKTHTADEIVTDSRHRFVTDKQISDWTDKETVGGALSKAQFALEDAKTYTNERITELNEKKFDAAKLVDNKLVLIANGVIKEIIQLPLANKVEEYKLPKASESVLGGIKIGNGLIIKEDGTVDVSIEQGITSVSWEDILNKPKLFPPTKHIHKANEISGIPTKVSDLENDNAYVDINHDHNNLYPSIDDVYSKSEVDELLKQINPDFISKEEERTINSYKVNIPKSEFVQDKNTPLKRTIVEHNLNTEEILLEAIDAKTKDSLVMPYRIIHKNSVELYTEHPENTSVYLLSGEDIAQTNEIQFHKFNIKKEAFAFEEEIGLYSSILVHNCNSEDIIVNMFNEENKESLVESYKIINNNEIKIYLEKLSNINVTIFTSEDIEESKVINTCTEMIPKEQFVYDDVAMLYHAVVIHPLNTSNLIIKMIDMDTKECITPAYRILDNTSLEIYSNEQISIKLFAVSGDINNIINDYIL